MNSMMKRFVNNFDNITKYYNFLINKTKKHEYVGITNEWLIDNYYLLVEHKNELLRLKKKLKKSSKNLNEHYYYLRNIVHKRYYNVDFKYLVDELKKYQKDTNYVYTYKELRMVIPLLIIIYTEKLNKLCLEEYKKFADKEKIEYIIKKIGIEEILDKTQEMYNICIQYQIEFFGKSILLDMGKDNIRKELAEYHEDVTRLYINNLEIE